MSLPNSEKISDVESSHESSSVHGETRQVDIVNNDINTTEIETLKLNTYDMWAVGMIIYFVFAVVIIVTLYNHIFLGITIVIGGQYFAWNYGLTVGLGSFIIATFLIGMCVYIFICIYIYNILYDC